MDIQEFRKRLEKSHNLIPNEGIYALFSRSKIFQASPEHVLYEFEVAEEDVDADNNLHNGCLATLIDVLTSSAAYGAISSDQPGVTTDLNITYLGTAKIGEKLIIECKTIKKGSRLAFFKAKIFKKDNQKDVIAYGTQTLAVSKNAKPSSKL